MDYQLISLNVHRLFSRLQLPTDAEVWTRLLFCFEDNGMTLQMITTKCEHLVNLKHDTTEIEAKGGETSVNYNNHSVKPSRQNTVGVSNQRQVKLRFCSE